jgi:hypothetical protein
VLRDHHGTSPQLKTQEGASELIPPLDRTVAAPIERGLYDSTRVVAIGVFGRTRHMNKDAGRDHRGKISSALMSCGSMRIGQVIGRGGARGEDVVDRRVGPQDLTATVYHHLGIDARSVTSTDESRRPTHLIDSGEPIRELVGQSVDSGKIPSVGIMGPFGAGGSGRVAHRATWN